MSQGPADAGVAVVAHYQATAGHGDQVAALLGRHTAATRAEPGCREFVALRGTADPDSFTLYERYESRGALESHLASAHYAAIAVAQIRPLLADRTVEFCEIIPEDCGVAEEAG